MGKQDNHDANKAESLADLVLTREQAEQAKAGTGLHAWHEDFVMVGNNEEEKHR